VNGGRGGVVSARGSTRGDCATRGADLHASMYARALARVTRRTRGVGGRRVGRDDLGGRAWRHVVRDGGGVGARVRREALAARL